ncbi:MAG: ATP-binding cassette domain-containing protein [Sphingomonadales bacterium]|nr:ATP-binding cassette domain-containing protein [Sphingomonadales bacterium]
MIRVENIKKSYGDVEAVKNVSFHAGDGEITALLGNNGSGKSTTMRSIMGLIKPSHGHCQVDGFKHPDNSDQIKSRMGYFPDRFGLYERLTARENITYFARLHNISDADLPEKITAIGKTLMMDDILDRRVKGFSTGQSMKVALARTLVHNPHNLMLDEPTRGLDVHSIRMMRDLLLDLKAKGHCILFSSHVMAEVEALADRIVIIANGVIVAEGTRDEICTKVGAPTLEDAFISLCAPEGEIA